MEIKSKERKESKEKMKKLVLFILLCGVAYAATFSELERRVFELEQQVAKLTIKVLDQEMAKESPILNATIDTNNYTSGLLDEYTDESDEDDEEVEIEYVVDEKTYELMTKHCVDKCTEEYNKSWHPSVEAAHKCMEDCMRF